MFLLPYCTSQSHMCSGYNASRVVGIAAVRATLQPRLHPAQNQRTTTMFCCSQPDGLFVTLAPYA